MLHTSSDGEFQIWNHPASQRYVGVVTELRPSRYHRYIAVATTCDDVIKNGHRLSIMNFNTFWEFQARGELWNYGYIQRAQKR